MADLTFAEKRVVKNHLIQEGYVLDYGNGSFADFIGGTTGLNVDDPKYSENNSGSKGQRLLKFIELESDFTVGTLLKSLFDEIVRFNSRNGRVKPRTFYDPYIKLFERLMSGGNVVEHIDAIQANNEDKDFHTLAKLIRESIEKNEPEPALDRLHTYLIKFLKELCMSHGVEFKKDETVNALFGKYIKAIKEKGFLESAMAEKIIQFSFQIMDAFNDIRNNKSFAHDNSVLNYDESVLIFSNITSTVKFIQKIEAKRKNEAVAEVVPDWSEF